ncbi:MAG: DNA primase, partial [Sphingomicrobium sp.]
QQKAGREAFEAVIEKAEPLDARLWRHEYQFAPLTTPEARAGLRQRLLDHASTIGDQSLARLYRDEWLSRFDSEVGRRQFQQSGPRARSAPRGRFEKGKFVPPILPPGSTARSIGSSGIDPQTARALMIGFVNFPDALADHAEQLAQLDVADAGIARVRDALVDSAFSGAKLDRDRDGPIFRALGVAGGSPSRSALSFSFTRADMDPDRACTDLAAAVEILTASEQVDRALSQATERCMQDTSQEAYDEQQRLIAAQQRLKQRLASLAGTD